MKLERAFIRDGDTTTADGVVQARPQQWPVTRDARHACFEGDPVACPACKGTGVTKCVAPFRPSTGPDGRQANLDGDLCLCKCPVPPRLVARFHNCTMGFAAHEIMKMPAALAWMAYAGHTEPLSRYDEFFVVHDAQTGQPVRGFSYGIATRSGEHHDALYDDGATAKAYAEDAQPMALTYLVQTRMGIRS
ncbi:MAG: hypothetical protein JWQ41_3079 [Variovorax sp.]|nr:hypothetical protein [Variovorax sp.]